MAWSAAIEDYLRAIYLLSQEQQEAAASPDSQPPLVSTSALATRLGVGAPAVTNMLKQLAQHRLVEHLPYRGVRLTPAGRQVALEVVRHHRLIERYLQEFLGFGWDEVHEEADRLEHVLSERLEERLAAALGEPLRDPHGEPIPRRDGSLPARAEQALSALEEGQRARVARVSVHEPGLLRYLASLGLVPGARVEVRERAPYAGPLRLGVGAPEAGGELAERHISAHLAQRIWVDVPEQAGEIVERAPRAIVSPGGSEDRGGSAPNLTARSQHETDRDMGQPAAGSGAAATASARGRRAAGRRPEQG